MQPKSNKFVVDSSVVIAYIQYEPGHEAAECYLEKSIISAVNFAEILSFGCRDGGQSKFAKDAIYTLLPSIIDFNDKQALITANLLPVTKKLGLSLADRACLGLAKSLNLPVVTADKVWKELDIGIEIILIR